MSDIVVTVPKNFTYPAAPGKRGLAAWLAEGDAPGSAWTGQRYRFSTWGFCPDIQRGERVYVVCEGRLVGYAPLVDLYFGGALLGTGRPAGVVDTIDLIRAGGAVACTIPEPITGFRGWRRRWWDRSIEVPLDLTKPATPEKAEGDLFQAVKP